MANIQLIQRLAHDYIFQVQQWQKNPFLGRDEYGYFTYWARHYAFEEIYWGIRQKNRLLLMSGRANINLLKSLNVELTGYKKIFVLLTSIINPCILRWFK